MNITIDVFLNNKFPLIYYRKYIRVDDELRDIDNGHLME